jgi:site-specific DNA-methyltransferase (adenine-specific)
MPEPYYQEDGISLYHGDWRDADRALFADADCVIADPPYGETSLDWDRWPVDWPSVLAARVKPTANLWCFGSARMFWEYVGEFGDWRLKQDCVWEKQNGSGFINDRFKRVHENAYHFTRAGIPWADVFKCPQFTQDATARTLRRKTRPTHMGHIENAAYTSEDGGPRLARSVIYAANCHGYAVNETQKPEGLVSLLIRYSCPVGGLVFSPFMGSGTDLVVARAQGMRAIGFDVREAQCEAAALRLSQGVMTFA